MFLKNLGLHYPVIQAPMAGVSTPAMAAAVSNAGALGSIGLGAEKPDGAKRMILATQALTTGAFNANVFTHRPATSVKAVENAWIERLRPEFARYGATPPTSLSEIYRSFVADDTMLEVLLELKPRVVSFHFGLPTPKQLQALRARRDRFDRVCNKSGGRPSNRSGGMDAVVAQGIEAGGHRGTFDPTAHDDRLTTIAPLASSFVASTSLSSRLAESWTVRESPRC